VSVLRLACQASPRLEPEVVAHWTARLTDDEAAQDAELAIARAHRYEHRGNISGAAKLLQQALSSALIAGETGRAQVIAEALARLSEAGDGGPSARVATAAASGKGPARRFARPPFALLMAITLCVCAVVTTVIGNGPVYSFVLLLAAALVLWFTAQFVDCIVALGLMAGWVILGIAKPADAAAGFSSTSWLFALAIFGLASAVARSGLLFRIGLLLVKRLPATLAWQATGILLTGLLLESLLPGNAGRVALVMPLASTIAEALRIEDRKSAAVVLGMSASIGSGGPLQFLFLNGAPVCILAWGLLPAETRQRFDWTFWFLAAAPLAVFVAGGAIVMLFLLLRPPRLRAPERERLEIQLAILGPPTSREWSMIAILLLTIAGFVLAPAAKLDTSIVAILALVAAVATGNLDGPALREINWNQLILIGVILSSVGLVVSLGIDRLAADVVSRLSGGFVSTH
jgi:di/tricarboxylate transporter